MRLAPFAPAAERVVGHEIIVGVAGAVGAVGAPQHFQIRQCLGMRFGNARILQVHAQIGPQRLLIVVQRAIAVAQAQ